MRKIALLVSLFVMTGTYAQEVGLDSSKEVSVYSIGTGFALSYFDQYAGVSIDSLHFLRSPARPFDNAFIKVGMGAKIDTKGDTDVVGYNFLASIGYMYIQDQYHEKSILNKFGTGVTLDYSLIEAKDSSIGVTLYIFVNGYLMGLGGGAIFLDEITPYVNTSLGLKF